MVTKGSRKRHQRVTGKSDINYEILSSGKNRSNKSRKLFFGKSSKQSKNRLLNILANSTKKQLLQFCAFPFSNNFRNP